MSAVQLYRVDEAAKRLCVSRVTFYSYFPQTRTRSQARAEG